MYDLIIIGGGPAGINCAIEAKRNNLRYVVLEKRYLVNTIYNFPTNMIFFSTSKNLEIADVPFISHNEKPTRMEALEYYRRLVDHYKLDIKYNQCVTHISKVANGYKVSATDQELTGANIVIAIGFYDTPRSLDVPGAHLPKVKHYYDDPHPYIDRNILVIGGANSACDVALETWSHGAHVTMAVRQAQLYQKVKYWILPNVQNRIKEGSITAHFSTSVKEITNETVVLDTPEGSIEIPNDYVLAMIGYKPDYTLIDQLGINYSDAKYKVPYFNPDTCETNVQGAYLSGVINGGLKTSTLFIENTRDQAVKIVKSVLAKVK